MKKVQRRHSTIIQRTRSRSGSIVRPRSGSFSDKRRSVKLEKSSKQQYTQHFEDFPQTELWRVWCDGWQQPKGKHDFSKEYYLGMEESWELLMTILSTPLTAKHIEDLHRLAGKYIDKIPNGFRKGGDISTFKLTLQTEEYQNNAAISPAGLDEFMEAALNALSDEETRFGNKKLKDWGLEVIVFDDPPHKELLYCDQLSKEELKQKLHVELQASTKTCMKIQAEKNREINSGHMLQLVTKSKKNIPVEVDHKLAEVYKKLNEAKNPDAKLEIIAALLKDFDRQHYFGDGNGRVFTFVMTNILLMQQKTGNEYDFCPMICHTPAHFPGFALVELVQELKDGMTLFKEYYVTNAKNYIHAQSSKPFLIKSEAEITDELNGRLSETPHIAIAQINDLYIKLKDNTIGFSDKRSFRPTEEYCKAQKQLFDVLSNLYCVKLQEVANDPSAFANDEKAFLENIENHQIIKLAGLSEDVDKIASSMPKPEDELGQHSNLSTHEDLSLYVGIEDSISVSADIEQGKDVTILRK